MPTTQSLEPASMNPKPVIPVWKAWWLAARPKTLPAAIAPVIAGSAVAYHEHGLYLPAAIAALITALLLQIAANFANDAIDFKKGADTAERAGPTRVTAGGLLTADAVLKATGVVLALAAVCGLLLVWRAGWPFLLLGLAAIVCAVAYTGGPFPISYLGLGELFVFLFFGLLAVAGTAYVQTLHLTRLALAVSVPIGALAVGILIVNNLRDIPTDTATGKRTLAVRIGARNTQYEYGSMLLIAMAAPPALFFAGWLNWSWLLTVFAWPVFYRLWRAITTKTGPALNPSLGNTGKGLLLYSVLLSAALVISR
jgi:1,4-dihydroxy-2-naphthoate octaprenyltransferase